MSKINPKRLREARIESGYSQKAIATKLGKTNSVVSKWEKGTHQPDIESMLHLTDIFGLPLAWFERPLSEETTVYQYRSNSDSTKSLREKVGIRLRWFVEMVETLEEWVEFPTLNLPISPNRLQALNLTDEDVEHYAYLLREQWELADKPIVDLIGVAESNGIIVTKEYINNENLDGVSAWFGRRPYIWLASDKASYYRSRFDMAHELGHIVLHRYLEKKDCLEHYHELERQAHLFASHFLVPRCAILHNYRSITLNNLLIPKRYWGISVGALIMQYHNLGIINDDYKTRLFKNYSYRKWRQSEPFDQQIPAEQPTLMSSTIQLLIEQGGFSKMDIIEYLTYQDTQIEALCSLPKGFFMPQKTHFKFVD